MEFAILPKSLVSEDVSGFRGLKEPLEVLAVSARSLGLLGPWLQPTAALLHCLRPRGQGISAT